MALTNPSPEEALQLFKDIERHFPSKTLGEERWQILAVLFPTSFPDQNGLQD